MTFRPIRKACVKDLDKIGEIAQEARAFLKQQQVNQWQGDYPAQTDFEADIKAGVCFVLPNEADIPVGVIVLCAGLEPAYRKLSEGDWLTKTQDQYLTIHRMATAPAAKGSGAAGLLLDFAQQSAKAAGLLAVRTDTHAENMPMRTVLSRASFTYCGVVVYGPEVEGGCERVAYEKVL